ncbi:methyltransferase domain-containing protein [Xinfangfangia sp. CPCC 101601]|uniref:Methyltransferase domain-containing protein n=1 Tax=Pseudogemmobacter lacusdianii TaxID=3069608 RepID=A0ABU0VTU1_9RHOB|nr:methyltransferase domain-containing protein [Xinfangfangia sp. CPCC 101601]MDQ2065150.1 methyltransferase domain-containing protein [Xinfangfangia sp. CPCC 101601]
MTQAPLLTDRPALMRNRARALSLPEPALFLQETAIDEVKERLESVNRTFTDAAVITGYPELWQAELRGILPNLRMVPDDDALNLAPQSLDLVVHAMALHWANDPVGQLVQARRVLRPDGLLLALFFGGQTLQELRAVLAEAEAEVTGGLSPRVLPMGEIRDLGALLQRAGLALPVADSFTQTVRYRSALHLMRDLRAMGEGNALAQRLRRPTRRKVLLRAAELYQQSYQAEDGRIPATFEILCLTGWAEHEGQQKPLRPGSAQQRLADALNTAEMPLRKGSQPG